MSTTKSILNIITLICCCFCVVYGATINERARTEQGDGAMLRGDDGQPANAPNPVNQQPNRPVTLKALNVLPVPLAGECGETTAATVHLSGRAPSGGVVVALTSTNPAVSLPATINIPAGAVNQKIALTTRSVSSMQSGTLTARLEGVALSKPIVVRPAGVKSISLNRTSLAGGNTATGVVTLECGASSSAIQVKLSSSNATLARPIAATIEIPPGKKSAAFSVNTQPVARPGYTYLRATANGVSKNVKLTIEP
ncbi:MAG: hypothetical protein MSG64_13000 [Pyrinomonadaceae bacterium MAG19_C2-C3]|nr:hypothetical protein [Pyrinomonadaceae bacterium MAG19_C2-C3]